MGQVKQREGRRAYVKELAEQLQALQNATLAFESRIAAVQVAAPPLTPPPESLVKLTTIVSSLKSDLVVATDSVRVSVAAAASAFHGEADHD